jgi:hypothetical protein
MKALDYLALARNAPKDSLTPAIVALKPGKIFEAFTEAQTRQLHCAAAVA